MALKKLLEASSSKFKKEELTEKRISDQMDILRQYFSFYREYPDLFLDFLVKVSDKNATFKGLFFYQRVFLRVAIRYRYVYATFPRAYSKSFLAVLILIMRCILYPNANLFVTTGGKEQAAMITKTKVEEWLKYVPALKNEIDWSRGSDTKTSGRDNICYAFKNGAKLSIVGASQKARGDRRTGGLVEEVITVDQTILNEVIIPMMNVDRLLGDGTRRPEESVNQSQIYVTSAGYKNSYAYEKLITFLVNMIIHDGENHTFVMGGSYKIPIMEGLLKKDFISDLRDDPTFVEESFEREYESIWSGASDGAIYKPELIERARVVKYPERSPKKTGKVESYYVFGIDYGRLDCTTEICIFKVYPQKTGISIKSLVNIYSIESENSLFQAVDIHNLYDIFKPEVIAIDGNGAGIGLLDILTLPFTDPRSGKTYEPWGVINDDKKHFEAQQIQYNSKQVLYVIKADDNLNDEAHRNVQDQFRSGKIRLLISEKDASETLSLTKAGDRMSSFDKRKFLLPYTLTNGLQDQLLNLYDVNEDKSLNPKIKVDTINKSTQKDRFSAFEYGLYYINLRDKQLENSGFNISDFLFFG